MNEPIRKKLHHYNDPGQVHSLTFSCYRRMPLLSKDRSRQWLVDSFALFTRKYKYECLAYVIMPEHVHILVVALDEDYNISELLQSIKQSVSIKVKHWLLNHNSEFLEKLTVYDRKGRKRFRFWQQGGGYDRNIVNEKTLDRAIEYIHNNPVRRGLVMDPLDWRWSSAMWHERGRIGSIFEDTQPPELRS
mgnify:CR=1 FL=1